MKHVRPYIALLFEVVQQMYGVRVELGSCELMTSMRTFIVHTDGWPRVFTLTEECYQNLEGPANIEMVFRAELHRAAGDLLP